MKVKQLPGSRSHRAARLRFHYTPLHGSWLNMAEIELSILSRQCLKRRIPDEWTLATEIVAWELARNAAKVHINGRSRLTMLTMSLPSSTLSL